MGAVHPFADAEPAADSWSVAEGADGELQVGPTRAFGGRSLLATVGTARRGCGDALDPGRPVAHHEVRESTRSFTVAEHRFDGFGGVRHPGGDNWIWWTDDRRRWLVEEQPTWPATWVHVRYVLRHIWTAGHAACGRPSVHATAATRPGADGWVVLAGPTRSGKSRLMNRLLAAGSLGECVEDDCPVVGPGDALRAVMPTQHEVRSTRVARAVGWILLDEAAPPDSVGPVDDQAAAAFLATTRPVWPLRWLPVLDGAARRAGPPVPDPAGRPALAVPARADADDAVVAAVAAWLADLP
jgi:hypothetical protein